MPERVVIMGAAGRDFHDFNVHFRGDPGYEVVAFTADQIPGIEEREYPAELAGPGYDGPVPIEPADRLEALVRERDVDQVVLSYSDLRHEFVMHQASRALSAGADFRLLGPKSMQLEADVPVVAVCAVRTGCGKSQTTRRVAKLLTGEGLDVVVVRHPMPYGDLAETAVQRFETREDLDRYDLTLEEREEYEQHVDEGNLVYAGVDYGRILARAQEEADVLLWDGGNNDLPFYSPDLHVVLADPLRAGHEKRYHPGEANVRMADVALINKVDTASADEVRRVRDNVYDMNPDATVVEAASPISVDRPGELRGRRVLVVEDGPTVTHGEMGYGAGLLAAERYGAEPVDPADYVEGSLAEVYGEHPHLERVVPAFGYSDETLRDLELTVANAAGDVDAVVLGTPSDLSRVIVIETPVHRVSYELECIGSPKLEDVVVQFAEDLKTD